MKRISCKVVRSVPFTRSDDASQKRQRGTERRVDGGVEIAAVGFESPCNSHCYTFRADALKAAFGESAAGLLLDCLA